MSTVSIKPVTAREFMDIPELWIIDTARKRVHRYRFDQSAEQPAGVHSVRQKFESPLFPGWKIAVAEMFVR